MLELLFSNTAAETLTLSGTLLILGSSLFLGLFISLVYLFTHKSEQYNGGFAVTLIMLPAIIAMIILVVGNNVARAFSLAGAFSLIRFRSAPGDPKDITFVFFTLGVGLACGMGYIGYAALAAVVMCAAMIILHFIKFGDRPQGVMRLRITVPENMDYHGVFDEVVHKYTKKSDLVRIKTAEFGTLFELTYDVTIKDLSQTKAFIDQLRCKNGNLNVMLSSNEFGKPATF